MLIKIRYLNIVDDQNFLCELLIMRMIKRARKELVLYSKRLKRKVQYSLNSIFCHSCWSCWTIYPLNRSENNVSRLPLGVGHIFVHSRQESNFSYTVLPNLTLIFLPHALLRKLTFLFFISLLQSWLTNLSTRALHHIILYVIVVSIIFFSPKNNANYTTGHKSAIRRRERVCRNREADIHSWSRCSRRGECRVDKKICL